MNRINITSAAPLRKAAFILAAAAVMILIIIMIPVRSCAADDYTYKMRVSGGNNGVLVKNDGTESAGIEYTVKAGEGQFPQVSTSDVKVTNNKYVVVGFKEAGRDTLMQTVPAVSSTMSDRLYVAVYGVQSNLVKYTVQYLDGDGASLMDDAVYYGPAGSEVMVSFKYIEGYAPTAYNLTKTLAADSNENVLAFRYYESDLTARQQNNTANNANNANNANANAAPPAANPAAAQAAAIDAATPGTPDTVNLDEGDVPLAGPEADAAEEENMQQINPFLIGAAAVIAAAIIALVIAMIRRRSQEYEEYEEDDE
ncbi:MAG: hypothetical protein J6D57_08225 [Mogibacterium sp.]|nr:hypothetical protein [Mogibacterium sp.]